MVIRFSPVEITAGRRPAVIQVAAEAVAAIQVVAANQVAGTREEEVPEIRVAGVQAIPVAEPTLGAAHQVAARAPNPQMTALMKDLLRSTLVDQRRFSETCLAILFPRGSAQGIVAAVMMVMDRAMTRGCRRCVALSLLMSMRVATVSGNWAAKAVT
jgi:hypothetical protein